MSQKATALNYWNYLVLKNNRSETFENEVGINKIVGMVLAEEGGGGKWIKWE